MKMSKKYKKLFNCLDEYFYTKKNISLFFLQKNWLDIKRKLVLNKEIRKNLYFEQNLAKKSFVLFKKRFFLAIFTRVAFWFFSFSGIVPIENLGNFRFCLFWPGQEIRLGNMNNSVLEGSIINFNLTLVVQDKLGEFLALRTLGIIKRMVLINKNGVLKKVWNLYFRIFSFFFSQSKEIYKTTYKFSKRNLTQKGENSRFLRLSNGKFSCLLFFIWKLKPRFFLVSFGQYFLSEISFEKNQKNFLLNQNVFGFFKSHFFGSFSGTSFFWRIYCLNLCFEIFWVGFLGNHLLKEKGSFSEIQGFRKLKSTLENFLRWSKKNEEKPSRNFLINDDLLKIGDSIGNFLFMEKKKREMEKSNFKKILGNIKKNFNRREIKKSTMKTEKFSFFSNFFIFGTDSETNLRFFFLNLSQLPFDLFQYLRKMKEYPLETVHVKIQKLIFKFLSFQKNFFFI